MKHLKPFEYQNIPPNTWIIPLEEPHFNIALLKLGMEDTDRWEWEHLRSVGIFFKGQYSKPLPNATHIAMEKHDSGGFTWSSYDDKKEDYEGVEVIKVSEKEVKEWKLQKEMEKEADKFNI